MNANLSQHKLMVISEVYSGKTLQCLELLPKAKKYLLPASSSR